MKSLRVRLALWFGGCFLLVTAVFTLVTYRNLEAELRQKTWQKNYPEHPDWALHGSYSEAEVRDVLAELISAAVVSSAVLVLLAAGAGYWLAHKSLQPIAAINRQLAAKQPQNLGVPITLAEGDDEFRELLRQLNELLKRLDSSFREMNTYAGRVAHELRTPLAIMRLKLERAEGQINPELGEDLQEELHRLTHVVDQSLLIARAEIGRLRAERTACDLALLVTDMAGDFQLLAQEEGRQLSVSTPAGAMVMADARHLRQIIHGLLTNALKHGQENLAVRVRLASDRASLLIVNRVQWCALDSEAALGLGLRVVAGLLGLDPDLKFHRRRANNYYAVRLTMPRCAGHWPPPMAPPVRRPLTSPRAVTEANKDFFI